MGKRTFKTYTNQGCTVVDIPLSSIQKIPTKAPIANHFAFSIWHLPFSIWHLPFSIWHLAFGIYHLAFGIYHYFIL